MSVRFTAQIRDGALILPPDLDLSDFPDGETSVELGGRPPDAGLPVRRIPPRPPGFVAQINTPHMVAGARERWAKVRRLPDAEPRDDG